MKPILLVLLLGAASPALAHDDNTQAPRTFDYSRAEATPFGIAADPRKARRTVRVDMTDAMRYTPATITVPRGETVRFVAANKGQVLHEMVLGTLDELKKHAELMKNHPGMEHDEPHMAHVAPGRTGVIGWKFTRAGTFYFACLVPGHLEAGMIGKVIVKHHAAASADGEIRRIDRDATRVTIKHGEIRSLDMPAMTMVFQVEDPALLEGIRVGDKVRFTADKATSGYRVTSIEISR